jgi:hypothetical protein
MPEALISKETLQQKLNTIKETRAKRQWKYYHLESVQNFIVHLNSFSSERTRERIAIKIDDYLSLLAEKISEEHNPHSLAKELYPSIWRIADEYKYGVGFISKPSYPLYFFIWTALFFILKSSVGSWVAIGVVAAIVIISIFRSQTKIKAQKYF